MSTSERLSRLLQHQKQLKQPSLLPLLPVSPSAAVISSSGNSSSGNSSSHSVLDAHLRLPELRARLARLLEAGSSSTGTAAAADNLKRRLDIPAGLLDMVASHVIQEAEDEPYGLNGE